MLAPFTILIFCWYLYKKGLGLQKHWISKLSLFGYCIFPDLPATLKARVRVRHPVSKILEIIKFRNLFFHNTQLEDVSIWKSLSCIYTLFSLLILKPTSRTVSLVTKSVWVSAITSVIISSAMSYVKSQGLWFFMVFWWYSCVKRADSFTTFIDCIVHLLYDKLSTKWQNKHYWDAILNLITYTTNHTHNYITSA